MFENIISGSEDKFTSEHFRRNKQKISAGKKSIEEKQTILKTKIFYCIRKYFIMWDVQSHSITRRSGNDLEIGCL